MILHKHPEITEPQLLNLDPRLALITEVAAYLAWTLFKDDWIVTAIHDPLHPGKTHQLIEAKWRFLDAGILKNGGIAGSERIRNALNALFPYEGRPGLLTVPALVHISTLGEVRPAHYHIQVGPRKI